MPEGEYIPADIATRIKTLRLRLKLSPQQFADLTNISLTLFRQWENGTIQPPDSGAFPNGGKLLCFPRDGHSCLNSSPEFIGWKRGTHINSPRLGMLPGFVSGIIGGQNILSGCKMGLERLFF